jgi:hypothetical protein
MRCEIGSDYFSVASKWIHKNKCYDINIFTTTVLRGIWLTRNNFIFNKQSWLDVKVVLRRILSLILELMETYLQIRETEGDDDMVVFFGEIDPRAVKIESV